MPYEWKPPPPSFAAGKPWLETGDKNPLWQILELLNTPQNFAFGGLQSLIERKNPLAGAIRGTYANTTFEDVLGSAGWKDDSSARTVAGLAGDIVLDPLNLLAVGPVAKALRAGASAAGRATGLTAASRALVESAPGRALQNLGRRAFGTSGRLGGPEVLLAENEARAARAALRIQRQQIVRLMSEFANQGASPEVLERLDKAFRVSVYDPSLWERISKEGLPSAQELAERFGTDKDTMLRILAYQVEHAPKLGLQGELVGVEQQAAKAAGREAAAEAKPKQGVLFSGPTASSTMKAVEKTFADHFGKLADSVIDDPVFDHYGRLFRAMREGSQAVAAQTGGVKALLADEKISYLLHYATPQLRRAILETPEGQALGREWSVGHASLLARKLPGDIETINAMARDGALPGLQGTVIEKAVYDDPFMLETLRSLRDRKAQITGLFFQRLFQQGYGRFAKIIQPVGTEAAAVEAVQKLPEGWKIIDIMPGMPEHVREASDLHRFFSRVAWSPDVAPTLERYVEFATRQMMGDDTEWRAFLDFWDATTSAYKQLTLGWRPAYHARNVVGNAFLLFLSTPVAELPNLGRSLMKAAAIQRVIDRRAPIVLSGTGAALGAGIGALSADEGESLAAAAAGAVAGGAAGALAALRPDAALRIGTRPYSPREAWELAEQFGVVKGGRYSGEVLSELSKSSRFQFHRKLSETAVIRAGHHVGTVLEDNARFGLFLHNLSKGMLPTEAAMHVKKYLFDYEDLTGFEQKVMKRIMPFYTWIKKNGVLQVSELVHQPYKYAPLSDVVQAVESTTEPPTMEDRLLPEFLRDRIGVRFRRGADGLPEYFLLGGWIPQADLAELAKPFEARTELRQRVDTLMQNLSPFLRLPIETVANYSFFFSGEIERFPGEKQKFLGLDLPKRAVNVLRSLIILNEADRTIDAAVWEGFSDRQSQTIPQWLAQTTSGLKLYRVDEGRALASYFYRLERETGRTKALLRRAARTGDKGDFETLMERYRNLAKGELRW